MGRYIDANSLREEIVFMRDVYNNPKRVVRGVADAFRQDGRVAMCDDILKKIDSLQQEQKGIDLEEEIQNFFDDRQLWDIQSQPSMEEVARHFYQLGKNSK